MLLSAGPGEMYPQIPLKVAELVGARGHMTAGLAGDQLGYLIAPFEAYPEPIRRSFFNQRGRRGLADRQRQLLLQRLAHDGRPRDVLAAARRGRDVRARASSTASQYQPCALFANDLLRAHGADAGRRAEARLKRLALLAARRAGASARRRPRRREVYRDGPVQAARRRDLGRAEQRRWSAAAGRARRSGTAALVDRRGARPRVERAARATSRSRWRACELGQRGVHRRLGERHEARARRPARVDAAERRRCGSRA